MEKISSFQADHNKITPGIYIARVDGDVITFDLRIKTPNNPDNDYLTTTQAHTFEHLGATILRNSKIKDQVLYFGPMGCRTGFYLLLKITHDSWLEEYTNLIGIIIDMLTQIINWSDEVPGNSKVECGNYKDLDLYGAKQIAMEYIDILMHKTEFELIYPGGFYNESPLS